MAYTTKNIRKSTAKAPGAGGGWDQKIILIAVEDVLEFPAFSYDGSLTITDNIVMKQGKSAIEIDATEGTVRLKHEGVGDRDGKLAKTMVEFSHPGSEKEVEEFLSNCLNKDYYVGLKNYRLGVTRLCGTPGNSLSITANSDSGTKGDEPNKSDFVFENVGGERAAFYEGTFLMLNEVQLAADATSINNALGNSFVTQTNTIATEITGITNAVVGSFITIRGGSNTLASTIDDETPFSLSAQFVATKGSELVLYVAGATNFIEISRT